jgi:hypothetical protein
MAGAYGVSVSFAHATSSKARCAEDDSCWNWATMGNQRRGIVDRWGNPRIVGPCEFAYRVRHRMIDRPTSDRMRGDATAMRCVSATLKGARVRDQRQGEASA